MEGCASLKGGVLKREMGSRSRRSNTGVAQRLPRVLLKGEPEMTAVWELREQPGHFGAGRKSSRIFLKSKI